ncbi:hypothetical protein [Burkholderia sp. Bp9143]|nr:hypothetical protein [Burkholderia sp. Bp9143]
MFVKQVVKRGTARGLPVRGSCAANTRPERGTVGRNTVKGSVAADGR